MKRDGFTIVEVSVAITLLAVCAILFVQLVAFTASERISERTRQVAIDQMQNVLERLAITPPEQLAAGNFDKIVAESLIERFLPEGKIAFETKRINASNVVLTITVSWNNGEKRPRKEIAMFRLLTLQEQLQEQ